MWSMMLLKSLKAFSFENGIIETSFPQHLTRLDKRRKQIELFGVTVGGQVIEYIYHKSILAVRPGTKSQTSAWR